MTSVWFAASGSGEDGDEYDVHEVFATEEAMAVSHTSPRTRCSGRARVVGTN